MTAGRGISHAEMVGLRNGEAENEGMVFQIWMNLPKKSKKAPPFTKMFWREDTPVATSPGGATVRVFAGDGANDPPPDSWAADATNHVVVRLISLPPGASVDVSRASPTTTLSLYPFDFKGATLDVVDAGGRGALSLSARDELCTLGVSTPIVLKNAAASGVVQVLQLEAEPIGEPVAWHGPFGALPASVDSRARFFRPSSTRAAPAVANSQREIQEAFSAYQRGTLVDDWPWPEDGFVHGDAPRFYQASKAAPRDERGEPIHIPSSGPAGYMPSMGVARPARRR